MSYSIIKDYTNKQGKVHQAHFSSSGKYLGPVSKKGVKPFLLTMTKPVAKEPVEVDCDVVEPVAKISPLMERKLRDQQRILEELKVKCADNCIFLEESMPMDVKLENSELRRQRPVIAECMLMDDYVKKLQLENIELRKKISKLS